MNAPSRFCKALNIKRLPPPVGSTHKVAFYCKSAAYIILPCKARALSGGIFCVLLLGLMLGFSACSKYAKVPEPVEGPTLKNDTAPNQGVSFEIDTTWSGDTCINFSNPFEP